MEDFESVKKDIIMKTRDFFAECKNKGEYETIYKNQLKNIKIHVVYEPCMGGVSYAIEVIHNKESYISGSSIQYYLERRDFLEKLKEFI